MLYRLTTPLSFKDIAPLRYGDEVLLSGTIITARDKAHAYLVQRALSEQCTNLSHAADIARNVNSQRNKKIPYATSTQRATSKHSTHALPFDLDGACLYHCGPLVSIKNSKGSLYGKNFGNLEAQNDSAFAKIIAAGPTTSSRMEPYMAEIIRRYGVRMIIGKGGMDDITRKALRKRAVYCSAVGGAAQVLAQAVQRIENVYGLKEFGETEAFWVMRVKNFPVMVTMDAHGGSLHEDVKKVSLQKLKQLIG